MHSYTNTATSSHKSNIVNLHSGGSPNPAIRRRLAELNNFSRSIEASAVMTRDGFPVVTMLSGGVDPDRLSAISASMLSLSSRASSDLDRGELDQVLIRSNRGYIVLAQVDNDTVLSVLSRYESRLGMLLVETKKAAEDIASQLKRSPAKVQTRH